MEISNADSIDVSKVLPQKFPFLFIDRVIHADRAAQKLTCLKNVTGNESFFRGHFPGNPVMPGVIIVEAMAQAGILLYACVKPGNMSLKPAFYLGKVEAAFKKPVLPGDTLLIEVCAEKIIDSGGIVKALAKVGETTVAEALLHFGVKLGKQHE